MLQAVRITANPMKAAVIGDGSRLMSPSNSGNGLIWDEITIGGENGKYNRENFFVRIFQNETTF